MIRDRTEDSSELKDWSVEVGESSELDSESSLDDELAGELEVGWDWNEVEVFEC